MMKAPSSTLPLVVCALVGLDACHHPATSSSPAVAAADWPSYNRTLAGDRFSPLTAIGKSNVSQLRQRCEYTLPEVAALQSGPVVVGGAMYFSTDTVTYAI